MSSSENRARAAGSAAPADGRRRAGLPFLERYDALSSLALAAPVFLAYHLGLPFMSTANGADLLTQWLLALARASLAGYAALTVTLAALMVLIARRLRSDAHVSFRRVGALGVEGLVWAVVMAVTVGWATAALTSAQAGAEPRGVFESVVASAGAGFHEEIVFRVGVFGGLAWLLAMTRLGDGAAALLLAGVASSVLFSAFHYVGELGDTFRWSSFVFRALMGAFLAALFHFRGLAVAIYGHFLYDVIFFLLLAR